jgi:hypothetical protein
MTFAFPQVESRMRSCLTQPDGRVPWNLSYAQNRPESPAAGWIQGADFEKDDSQFSAEYGME